MLFLKTHFIFKASGRVMYMYRYLPVSNTAYKIPNKQVPRRWWTALPKARTTLTSHPLNPHTDLGATPWLTTPEQHRRFPGIAMWYSLLISGDDTRAFVSSRGYSVPSLFYRVLCYERWDDRGMECESESKARSNFCREIHTHEQSLGCS